MRLDRGKEMQESMSRGGKKGQVWGARKIHRKGESACGKEWKVVTGKCHSKEMELNNPL